MLTLPFSHPTSISLKKAPPRATQKGTLRVPVPLCPVIRAQPQGCSECGWWSSFWIPSKWIWSWIVLIVGAKSALRQTLTRSGQFGMHTLNKLCASSRGNSQRTCFTRHTLTDHKPSNWRDSNGSIYLQDDSCIPGLYRSCHLCVMLRALFDRSRNKRFYGRRKTPSRTHVWRALTPCSWEPELTASTLPKVLRGPRAKKTTAVPRHGAQAASGSGMCMPPSPAPCRTHKASKRPPMTRR